MATPAEPATTEPAGALFRALRSVDVDPELAYRADDEVRASCGILDDEGLSTRKAEGRTGVSHASSSTSWHSKNRSR